MVPNRDRYQSTFFEKGASLSFGKRNPELNASMVRLESLRYNLTAAPSLLDSFGHPAHWRRDTRLDGNNRITR